MESMDFVYSHRQEWALHGLVQKKKCSCTVVCKRGKRFWGPMCCESKLQPHVKDGSIRKPKRTKQSIYARCYLNMHAVDFIFLYFFGGGYLICAAGIPPQTQSFDPVHFLGYGRGMNPLASHWQRQNVEGVNSLASEPCLERYPLYIYCISTFKIF